MSKIDLAKISTRAPRDLQKENIKAQTKDLTKELDELQNKLYAESKWSHRLRITWFLSCWLQVNAKYMAWV